MQLEEIIDGIQRNLITRYVILFTIAMFAYAWFYYHFLVNLNLSISMFFLGMFVCYTWFLIRKSGSVKRFVHYYFVIGPVFVFFFALGFWSFSVIALIWLLPLPLAANIFFEKKIVFYYTFYVFFVIFSVTLAAQFITFDFVEWKHEKYLSISGTFAVIINAAIFILIFYYQNKIRKAEIEQQILTRYQRIQKGVENKEIEYAKPTEIELNNEGFFLNLFEIIDQNIRNEESYKNPNYNVAALANSINTNSLYISKAVKAKGYRNYNHYLNSIRINHVKSLIAMSNMEKVTLMYIYSDSGFGNQSTFNRVFKQIEGITPSEYIETLKDVSFGIEEKKMIIEIK